MTTWHGKDGVIKQGSSPTIVAETTSFSIEESADTQEDTAQRDDWRTRKSGLKSWTGSIEGHYDPDDTDGQAAFTIGSEVDIVALPGGDTSGAPKLEGTGVVTSRSVSSEMEGIVSVSISVEGNGELQHNSVT